MPQRSSSILLTDHIPLRQISFRGLYARGVDDIVPDSYQQSSSNNIFSNGGIGTRDGLALNVTKSNVRRFFVYKRINENPRFIILDTSGNLFDSLAPGTPIYTDASFVDFSMACSNNRAYISPHDRKTGIAGKSVLVYQGSGNARVAGGLAPTGFTLAVANSVSSGHVETGLHLFAQAFITDTGFITAPGPQTWTVLSAPGGFAVNFSSIAVGPTGTVARILLGTKSIPVNLFNGNQFAYELFFIPNAIINDNTTTVLNGVSFFDADLIDSADYLIDNRSTIPAGVGIGFYNGRMIVWGENANQFTVRVSNKLQPESFNSISGFANCDPADAASGVRNCFEHRKTLIICTNSKLLGTADNDSDPSTWTVPTLISKDVGTECFGIATIQDARGTNIDRVFIADRSGLISFEGYAKRPELSYNIENYWARINKARFDQVQVTDDPTNHRLIVSVPLDSSTTNNAIFFGDYNEAITVYQTIDERMIKWSIWTFPSDIVSMSGDLDNNINIPVLHYALTGGNIYTMREGLRDDFGNAISSTFSTSFKAAQPGWINHFGLIHVKVVGSGSLVVKVKDADNSVITTYPSIIMGATPGREYDVKINRVTEKASVRFDTSLFGDWYTLTELILYSKPVYAQRPA